jgi:tRNA-specific 2-thiouridylase
VSNGQQTVFVGLSGGVDSAVSAALLKEQGYKVVGAFIRIALPGYPCTAGQDRVDAMRVAAHLQIPFVEVDLSKEYEQKVFNTSIGEFAAGKTPNPDVLCNREIKFGLFYNWARGKGADLVATGHYARVASTTSADSGYGDFSAEKSPEVGSPSLAKPPPPAVSSSRVHLFAGADPDKDQSYFLALVPQDALRHTLFPVGSMVKPQVRALAAKFGLPNAARPDSQGLCFLGPVSLSDMLQRELEMRPGEVLSPAGEVVGTHEGAARYTLGQRHGFTLAAQSPETRGFDSAHRKPHYVVGKDITRNTITVSPSKFPTGVTKTVITLTERNWIGEAPTGACEARYRYRSKLIAAQVEGNTVTLAEPHFVPEGQLVALYRGERCLGGGVAQSVTLFEC